MSLDGGKQLAEAQRATGIISPLCTAVPPGYKC